MDNPRKKQKGFQLPLEVIEWLEEEESKTGATLSRIALAAFCAYLLEKPANHPNIMRLAMAVERGHIQFRHIASEHLKWTIAATKVALQHETNKKSRESLKSMIDQFDRELQKLKSEGR